MSMKLFPKISHGVTALLLPLILTASTLAVGADELEESVIEGFYADFVLLAIYVLLALGF